MPEHKQLRKIRTVIFPQFGPITLVGQVWDSNGALVADSLSLPTLDIREEYGDFESIADFFNPPTFFIYDPPLGLSGTSPIWEPVVDGVEGYNAQVNFTWVTDYVPPVGRYRVTATFDENIALWDLVIRG